VNPCKSYFQIPILLLGFCGRSRGVGTMEWLSSKLWDVFTTQATRGLT